MRPALLVLFGMFVQPVEAADVFRCVTENGVVRYSDKPCDDGKVKKLDIENKPTDPAAAAAAAKQREQRLAELKKAEAEAQLSGKSAAEAAAARTEKCAQARERAQRLMSAHRVTEGAGQELKFLDSDEIEQRRQQAQDDVKEFCNN